MARSIRIEFPGAFYHVMARGNRREAIFLDDDDRRFFLHTLGEACGRTGWRLHAWVLMGNHYHLLLETPEPNLSVGMKWLQNAFTRRFNVRHRQWGRVFGDRYKAVLVDAGSGWHVETVLDYIHLNPVRARLIRPDRGQSVLDFPWSSVAGGYVLTLGKRAKWLETSVGFAAAGAADTVAGRRKLVERLDRRAVTEEIGRCGVPVLADEIDARCSHLRRGWYWGTREFAERMTKLVARTPAFTTRKSRAYARSAERLAHGEFQAERWLEEGLAAAGLRPADLPRLKGTDPRKVALASLLRQHTTVSLAWLAEHLHLSSAANAGQVLRLHAGNVLKRKSALPAGLRRFLAAASGPSNNPGE